MQYAIMAIRYLLPSIIAGAVSTKCVFSINSHHSSAKQRAIILTRLCTMPVFPQITLKLTNYTMKNSHDSEVYPRDIPYQSPFTLKLTQWGWVLHICVTKPTIIASDDGLSPDRRQAIIWTNAGLLLVGLIGTNFSELLIEILTFSSMKLRLKVSSAKRRPFCPGLNVLIKW